MWSAHPNEQKDLSTTHLAGTLPNDDGGHPTVGVFRNDGTGGKLGYYAVGSASLSAGSCDSNGARKLDLHVSMRNTAPSSGLPAYVTGLAHAGLYVLRTNVLIYAPTHGDINGVLVNGRPVPVIWARELDRKVGMFTVDLKPGEAASISASLTVATPAGHGRITPALQLTPGVQSWSTEAQPFDAC